MPSQLIELLVSTYMLTLSLSVQSVKVVVVVGQLCAKLTIRCRPIRRCVRDRSRLPGRP
jgi:hypothetical protein